MTLVTVTVTATDKVTLKHGIKTGTLHVGSRGLVGASVFDSTYPGARTRLGASTMFDAFAQRPMAANAQRVYFAPETWAADLNNPQPVAELHQAGTQLYVSLKPSRDLAQADLTSLAATVKMFRKAGIVFEATLWHEPNLFGPNGPFPSGGAYKAYVEFYGPVLRDAGVPIFYCPSMASPHNVHEWYPGDEWVDAVYPDYYCWDYISKRVTLADVMVLADDHKPHAVPFGIGETGLSNGKSVPTPEQFESWMHTQIVEPFQARLEAGRDNGPIIWYDKGQGGNSVTAATSPKVIAAIQAAYDALSS